MSPLLPNECPNCGRRHGGADFNAEPGPVQIALHRAEAQVAALLAESTRWQQVAQTAEELAWANVYHASLTRALVDADRELV